MAIGGDKHPTSYILLCATLALVTAVFGVRVKYTPIAYDALAGIQFIIICAAAWKLGSSAMTAEAGDIRKLAVAGTLLVAPWALFSFLPGIGPPGDQTHAENALRYLILLINSIAVTAGLIVLREALSDAGERFYSTLGFSAIILAAPPYLVWAAVAVGYFRSADVVQLGATRPGAALMENVLDVLLFFGGVLTYLATAAFAASLGRIQWLGRTVTRVYIAASLLALLCLVIRGLQFPVRAAALTHWSTIPGFVVGIPAVPWIMPLLFGVVTLRRAGNENQ